MTGFSSEWLALREPIDHAARSEDILSAVAHYFAQDDDLRITDIGSGTGSTLRALKPILSQKLSWHLIDYDASLMDVAQGEAGKDAVIFTLSDLSKSLDAIFANDPHLVTTSAFLDLVSKEWLQWMVTEITSKKVPFYAALTYDGRAGCDPLHAQDQDVIVAFNDHQKTDKGFGPALGPDAAETAISMFKEAGYIVVNAQSDWRGDKHHKAFQKMLLDGWRGAASEIQNDKSSEFDAWYDERSALIDEADASIFVGHEDFLAVPE